MTHEDKDEHDNTSETANESTSTNDSSQTDELDDGFEIEVGKHVGGYSVPSESDQDQSDSDTPTPDDDATFEELFTPIDDHENSVNKELSESNEQSANAEAWEGETTTGSTDDTNTGEPTTDAGTPEIFDGANTEGNETDGNAKEENTDPFSNTSVFDDEVSSPDTAPSPDETTDTESVDSIDPFADTTEDGSDTNTSSENAATKDADETQDSVTSTTPDADSTQKSTVNTVPSQPPSVTERKQYKSMLEYIIGGAQSIGYILYILAGAILIPILMAIDIGTRILEVIGAFIAIVYVFFIATALVIPAAHSVNGVTGRWELIYHASKNILPLIIGIFVLGWIEDKIYNDGEHYESDSNSSTTFSRF